MLQNKLSWHGPQHLQIFLQNCRTTLYSLQQLFASSNLICCETGLNVGGKTFAFQLVYRQCCETRSMSVCCPFYRRTYRPCRVKNVLLLNLLCRLFTICASPLIFQNLFLISPGYYSRPKSNWRQRLCLSKILGVKKVYCVRCANRECPGLVVYCHC